MVQPQARGFTRVEDETPESPPGIDQLITGKKPMFERAAIDMMQLALSTIWQQFIIAVASLFQLATVASVFVLWYLTPNPSQLQIASMSIYAVFILAINYLRRGR